MGERPPGMTLERPLYRIGDIRAVLWKITKAKKKASRERMAS